MINVRLFQSILVATFMAAAGLLAQSDGCVDKPSKPVNYVKDCGGGVYRFKCTGEKFAEELGTFCKAHPELMTATVARDEASASEGTMVNGYIVTFHPRPKLSAEAP